MKFEINNKIVNVFSNSNLDELPVFILNTYSNEGENIYKECNKLNTKDFILVSISNLNWNDDLTPWECPPIYKGDTKYMGFADKYLKELENDIVPIIEEYIINNLNKKISYYVIGGYSLGGLFSLYSGFNTDKFKRIVSVSGSLWYPNFYNYVKSNKISNNIDKIYFSLGNREKDTKNKLLSTVEDNTKNIYEYLSKNINSICEENEGNHFKDSINRMAKSIKWILE